MDQTHRECRRAAQWGNGDTPGLNAGRGINEDDQIDHGEVLSQFRCELKAIYDVGAVDGCLTPKCLGADGALPTPNGVTVALFFGSIHATLNHLRWADRIWMIGSPALPSRTAASPIDIDLR